MPEAAEVHDPLLLDELMNRFGLSESSAHLVAQDASLQCGLPDVHDAFVCDLCGVFAGTFADVCLHEQSCAVEAVT